MDIFETERAVREMHRKAEQVLTDVESQFNISHVVAAFSGGDDSIVSTHWTMERFADAVVMVGDTEIGLERTRQHQRDVIASQKWSHEFVRPSVEGPPHGWDDEWIDGETSYEESVLNYGFPGNGQHHHMYQRLKQRAFRKIKAPSASEKGEAESWSSRESGTTSRLSGRDISGHFRRSGVSASFGSIHFTIAPQRTLKPTGRSSDYPATQSRPRAESLESVAADRTPSQESVKLVGPLSLSLPTSLTHWNNESCNAFHGDGMRSRRSGLWMPSEGKGSYLTRMPISRLCPHVWVALGVDSD